VDAREIHQQEQTNEENAAANKSALHANIEVAGEADPTAWSRNGSTRSMCLHSQLPEPMPVSGWVESSPWILLLLLWPHVQGSTNIRQRMCNWEATLAC
jgi:hypothetical protein